MMTLKMSPLKALIPALLVTLSPGARALNSFECLRDLIPLSERGALQGKRSGVERPFLIQDKYIVFPEVKGKAVTGFYVYDSTGAWFYDGVETSTAKSIARLGQERGSRLYELVAQPRGLETITIHFMPGFDAPGSNKNGAAILGSSVLPVVGAVLSRPEKYDYVYQSPLSVPESELQAWVRDNGSRSRKPASAAEVKIEKQIVKLTFGAAKRHEELWAPLKTELSLRRKWLFEHNLDQRTAIEFSRVQASTCRTGS